MHEDLLGYLLGALDADEQRRIEAELAKRPELRQELDRLRESIEPLASIHDDREPPSGLAERVCASIERYGARCRPVPLGMTQPEAAAAGRLRRFSVADMVVLALVAMAAFTLFLPALANSRYQARKLTCQDNLRVLGQHLISYSQRKPDGRFPFVPALGNRSFAGVYAPTLRDNQLISSTSHRLICPDSRLAEEIGYWYIPSLAEVDHASRMWLLELQKRTGGSYAYNVGFIQDGRLWASRNMGRAHFALLADAPSLFLANRRSANHGGRGQNICYEDGHVVFVADLSTMVGDDPLRNQAGHAESGLDPDDAVLLPSPMHPIILEESSAVIDLDRD